MQLCVSMTSHVHYCCCDVGFPECTWGVFVYPRPLEVKRSLWSVLSGDRMEQMTKTYNDMDVVTQLLAEVRVRSLGWTLLLIFFFLSHPLILYALPSFPAAGQRLGAGGPDRSVPPPEEPPAAGTQRRLRGAASSGAGPGSSHASSQRASCCSCVRIRCSALSPVGQVHQLQHELSKKDELLRMVASHTEESETDSSVSTPPRQPLPPGGTTAAAALNQLESLRSKLQELEEENLALRSEVGATCQTDKPPVDNRKWKDSLWKRKLAGLIKK